MALIIDIETIGDDFERLDDVTKENLTRWIRREAADDENKYNVLVRDVKEGLGFSPLTGQIAALGVFDTERNRGTVYYQSPDLNAVDQQEENFSFKPRTEPELLGAFWQGAKNYKEFVTFNGRSFDAPFLNIRSAVHKIRPSVNLMSNRYGRQLGAICHIDLLDQLSYFGAVRRKGSLHLYCRAFGIKSPKAAGITGDDIARLFREKKYREIADYNSWDLIATWELFKVWQDYIKQ